MYQRSSAELFDRIRPSGTTLAGPSVDNHPEEGAAAKTMLSGSPVRPRPPRSGTALDNQAQPSFHVSSAGSVGERQLADNESRSPSRERIFEPEQSEQADSFVMEFALNTRSYRSTPLFTVNPSGPDAARQRAAALNRIGGNLNPSGSLAWKTSVEQDFAPRGGQNPIPYLDS